MNSGAKPEVISSASAAELLAALEDITEASAAVIRAGFWDEVGQHIAANPEGLRLIAIYALSASLLPPGKSKRLMSQCPVAPCRFHQKQRPMMTFVSRWSKIYGKSSNRRK